MATRRLGKGLSALIPDVPAVDAARNKSLSEIDVSSISPNPFQPRLDFDPIALSELKKSISENGLITPITVRRYDSGYQLIAGERRLRAVQELEYETIPAYVLNIQTDEEMLELSLVENIQRENLNPIEEALGYRRLIDECKLTQEDAARKVGKDRATVANFLRLLKLPAPMQESLRTGEVTAGHARALLACEDEHRRLALWKRIMKSGLSVRQAEKLAREDKQEAAGKAKAMKPRLTPELREAEDKLRQIFGTQVHIIAKDSAGSIQIEFYSESELDRLLELMQNLRA